MFNLFYKEVNFFHQLKLEIIYRFNLLFNLLLILYHNKIIINMFFSLKFIFIFNFYYNISAQVRSKASKYFGL